jgi:hypothetical protein
MIKVRFYVLLIATFILISVPSTHSTSGVTYDREATLYSTGLILLEDRISGLNGGDRPFILRLPRGLAENLLDYRAETADGLNLNVSIVGFTENETVVEVMDVTSSSLTLFFLVNGSALIGLADTFTIYVPVYPGLNMDIARLNFTLIIPRDAMFKDYPSDFNISAGKLWLIRENLEPDASRVEPISITGSPLIEVEEFSKTITVSEHGDVVVEEFYIILNVGSSTSQIVFSLPADACEVDAKDEFGRLQSSTNTEGGTLTLTVKPRYELRKGDRYSLTITYKFPAGLMVEHGLFKYSHGLSMELGSALPIVAESIRVNLKLPSYSTIVDVKPENYTENNGVLSWILKSSDHTPVLSPIRQPPVLMLNYNYNVLWSSFKPVLWTLCGLTTVAVVYYVYRARVAKTVEAMSKVKAPVATKEISEFISAYEEKLNLRREMRELESNYLTGNISRAEFSARSIKVKNRMAELDRMIENLKPTIRLAGFLDELTNIEEAEADLSICDVGLGELRNRYRTGKISKHVYERLLNEYNKRIRTNENRIRRAIEAISSG